MRIDGTTYHVRVYRTEVYKGVKVTTYRVRWKAGKRLWREGFRTAAQADSFRSALLNAARTGEAFSLATGRPTAWERKKADTTWYEFACAYVDMKWKQASAKYRKDIARALTAATPAMLAVGRERPEDASIRRALVRWGFNTKQRAEPPDDVAEVLAWVGRHTTLVSALAEAATARRVLEQATGRLDGKNAAASTARRNRTILANAMDYAVELGLLGTNPIRALKWTAPKVSGQVDRRSVVNPRQARALLDAVRAQQPSGPRLVAFFAVMYYTGLRPEEAINLTADNVILPPRVRDQESLQGQDPHGDEGWGELHIRNATPDAGSEWTDDGSPRDRRQLKHRAEGDSRIVPVHPELTRLLRDHRAHFGTAPDGRLFSGVRGGELPTITYRRVWIKARETALAAAEQNSPLARRPYDLRHACLSTWLNGGVYPTQVAEWAGHSVDVLLRIYAKCVAGQDELAKLRISEACARIDVGGPAPTAPDRQHASGAGQLNVREEPKILARIWRNEPQMAVSCRTQPHVGAESKIMRAKRSCRSQGLTRNFARWGGWGSNPRPADYENYGPTLRMRYLHRYHRVMPPTALTAPLAQVTRSTNRSTPHHGDHLMSTTERYGRPAD